MEGGSMSRRKSYTSQFKLAVVEVAKEKGNREAGRLFNVGESSVREWRKAETVLKSLHERKRAMRFRRCKNVHDDTFSEMEAQEVPKVILNAIDSFNVEPDEEFIGFE
jgi:F0F1-type ATP synthase gamma subunit